MRIDSSAPTRIDLAGGTLDIWPLYLFHDRAQTVNAAISLRAGCTLTPLGRAGLEIHSRDFDRTVRVDRWQELDPEPELRLLGRLLRFFEADAVRVETWSASPVGAGIAGSSALNVAACAALARWTDRTYEPEALLEIAMNLEAQALGVPTGVQDYRPALYGGISAVELGVDGVRRVELDVNPGALHCRLVLAYTGASRQSGINNWEVTRRHLDGDPEVFECFERIRDAAAGTRAALEAGDWPEVGRQVALEWTHRQRLAPGVSTPAIAGLLAAARGAGAVSGKVCGAGGGGCLFALAPPERLPAVRAALQSGGARLLDYHIDTEGLLLTESRAA